MRLPFIFVPPAQEYEQEQAPYRFVKKCRMHSDAVYEYCPREISWSAVSLTVEKIAPSADRLSEGDRRRYQIEHIERPDMLISAYEINGQYTEYEPSVDRETALAYIDCFRQRVVEAQIEEHIIYPCAYNAQRQHPQSQIKNILLFDPVRRGSLRGYEHGKHHACRDQNPVPSDLDTGYFKSYRIRMCHLAASK